jgi:hypothetical protein
VLGLVAALLLAAAILGTRPRLATVLTLASMTGFLLLSWSWILLGTERDAFARIVGGYARSPR